MVNVAVFFPEVAADEPSMNTKYFRRFFVVVAMLAIGVCLSVGIVLLVVMASRDPSKDEQIPGADPTLPMELTRRVGGAIAKSDYDGQLKRMELEPGVSLSGVVHGIHLFGSDCQVPHPTVRGRTAPAIETILDNRIAQEYFKGHPPLVSTRFGVRCRTLILRDAPTQPEREAHSGQLLAALAESRVPLSRTLTTPTQSHCVSELLADSLATFTLREPQIEWLATALALYLPPRTSWANKFGETFTFDDLTVRLMSSRFGDPELSCQGIHVLYALAVIFQSDHRFHVLSQEVRDKLKDFLANHANHLVESQLASGMWSADWYQSQSAFSVSSISGFDRTSVIVAGHHLEWLCLLPDDMQPPGRVFTLASQGLLEQMRQATHEQILDAYCPCSHAVFTIGLCSRSASGIWNDVDVTNTRSRSSRF